ncbi:hypothetical protein [Gracilibacillus salinarum]|uniref:DUF1492 domain-containing protein n=1 Tax=Gracilibacillus salinarum TaxID=2932255 RepID=A0ABY4GND3_9BACI|nr:hypothetical protein [Gracilibacillus salinarum]UOQ85680.1 hypothetical protein MUN87_01875 [Gracilibacillus salinarum]
MYEWLRDYQRLMQEIDYLEFELQRYKKELGRWSRGDLSDVKLTEKSKAANLEEIIRTTEHELAHKMNDMRDAKTLISMFKGLDNQILYLKYVEGMTLESIAEELTYSTSHIYKKHAEIMKSIKFAHEINSHFSFPQYHE